MKRKKIIAFVLAGIFATSGFALTEASAAAYTIQSDDTLYKISKQFDTTVDALKEMNNLMGDLIYPGDILEISREEQIYTIEQGDTLYRIAMEHDITVDQLQAWNDLNSDLIYVGDPLVVSGPLEEVTFNGVKSASSETDWIQPETDFPTNSATDSNVSKTMTVEATAYTAYCEGCSGTTANGTNLRANPNLKVIAVDPQIIPLGTKVWVEGYGEAIAADTGGAIKGNKIDVFIPNLDGAYEWGRRTVTIKILD
ncbi:LysM peptidoglycan-binding domain-containing protein [Solibacillus silvestris]|uniref:3D domain-containing protein n=1 Tax=Solibacillus silvestris TaxID=76853 RepID=UPI003F80081B